MPLVANGALRKLRAGELAIGFGLHHLRTAAAPQLAAAAGFDWLFIDTEHGAFSVQEATQICLAALPTGVTPIVRVCADAIDEATRALDNGAMGIVVPHVNTPAEARRIASALRFPPLGHRSWGGPPAIYGFQPPHPAEAQAAINSEILVCAMIETPEAVERAGEIASVPGIDALLIGTSDLSAEMGVSGPGRARESAASLRKRRRRLPRGEESPRHGRHLRRAMVRALYRARRALHLGRRRSRVPPERRHRTQPLPARACERLIR